MNGKNLFIGLNYIDRKYIEEAETGTLPEHFKSGSGKYDRTADSKQRTLCRPLLIAAVIALMLFLVGCAAVYVLRMQDMKIGEYHATLPEWVETPVSTSGEGRTYDVISLQGIAGTPNQQAAMEWWEFDQSYDTDRKLRANDFHASDAYDAYSVYTQEMVDKVDEIAQKYGLQLAGKRAVIQSWDASIFFDALGIEGLLLPDAQAEIQGASGYFYESGNFNLNFWLTLSSAEAQWPREILASLRYCGKAYLDTVIATVSDVNNFEQWIYTLADGRDLLIVMGDGSARIFCDREDAFLSVSFGTEYFTGAGDRECMSKRDVELVADALDFSVQPHKPDMAAVEKQLEESAQKKAAEEAAIEASIAAEPYTDPYIQDSYADYIDWLIAAMDNPSNLRYALMDLNGDGVEELLLASNTVYRYDGNENSFFQILSMKDGKTFYLGGNANLHLCEGNILERYMADESGGIIYEYYKIEDTALVQTDYLTYFIGLGATQPGWNRDTNGDGAFDEFPTEEEVMEIVNSHKKIDIDFKPVSEFPRT